MSTDDFTIDFSDVSGGDFDAIPAGKYNIAVTDWERVETGENSKKLGPGVPGVNWEFTIQDGQFENRKLWTRHYFHPNTAGFLKTFLKQTGKYSEEDLESPNFQLDPDDVVGAELVAVVVVKQYNGDDKNEIKKFKPKGAAEASSAGAASSMLP